MCTISRKFLKYELFPDLDMQYLKGPKGHFEKMTYSAVHFKYFKIIEYSLPTSPFFATSLCLLFSCMELSSPLNPSMSH